MASFKERFKGRICVVGRDGAHVSAATGEVSLPPGASRNRVTPPVAPLPHGALSGGRVLPPLQAAYPSQAQLQATASEHHPPQQPHPPHQQQQQQQQPQQLQRGAQPGAPPGGRRSQPRSSQPQAVPPQPQTAPQPFPAPGQGGPQLPLVPTVTPCTATPPAVPLGSIQIPGVFTADPVWLAQTFATTPQQLAALQQRLAGSAARHPAGWFTPPPQALGSAPVPELLEIGGGKAPTAGRRARQQLVQQPQQLVQQPPPPQPHQQHPQQHPQQQQLPPQQQRSTSLPTHQQQLQLQQQQQLQLLQQQQQQSALQQGRQPHPQAHRGAQQRAGPAGAAKYHGQQPQSGARSPQPPLLTPMAVQNGASPAAAEGGGAAKQAPGDPPREARFGRRALPGQPAGPGGAAPGGRELGRPLGRPRSLPPPARPQQPPPPDPEHGHQPPRPQQPQQQQQPSPGRQRPWSGGGPHSSSTTETAEYRPYTLAEYRKLPPPGRLGGLGPEDNEEKQHAREQRKRIREYAQEVDAANHSRLLRHEHAPQPAPEKPKEVVEAAARRQRALEFADHLPRPKVRRQPLPGEEGATDSEHGGSSPDAPQQPPQRRGRSSSSDAAHGGAHHGPARRAPPAAAKGPPPARSRVAAERAAQSPLPRSDPATPAAGPEAPPPAELGATGGTPPHPAAEAEGAPPSLPTEAAGGGDARSSISSAAPGAAQRAGAAYSDISSDGGGEAAGGGDPPRPASADPDPGPDPGSDPGPDHSPPPAPAEQQGGAEGEPEGERGAEGERGRTPQRETPPRSRPPSAEDAGGGAPDRECGARDSAATAEQGAPEPPAPPQAPPEQAAPEPPAPPQPPPEHVAPDSAVDLAPRQPSEPPPQITPPPPEHGHLSPPPPEQIPPPPPEQQVTAEEGAGERAEEAPFDQTTERSYEDDALKEQRQEDAAFIVTELHRIRLAIKELSEMGSPSDDDLATLESGWQQYKEQKLALAALLNAQKPGTKFEPMEGGEEEMIDLLAHICRQGDQQPGSVEVVEALLKHVNLDFGEIIDSEQLVALQCADGNRCFLQLLLDSPHSAGHYDNVEVVSAACFSQTARIPLVSIVLPRVELDDDNVDELQPVIQEFVQDICNAKKAIPKEDRTGRLALVRTLLTHDRLKVDPLLEAPDGGTLWSRACLDGDIELMKLLIELLPPEAVDSSRVLGDGRTPMQLVVLSKSLGAVSLALSRPGARQALHKADEEGNTPISISRLMQRKDIEEELRRAEGSGPSGDGGNARHRRSSATEEEFNLDDDDEEEDES